MKTLLLASVLAFTSFFGANAVTSTTAEGDAIIGKWLNQEGTSHIQIFKATNGSFAGKFYGKIVWLKVVNDPDGTPRKDINNPETSLRTRPLKGLENLRGFQYTGDGKWENGNVYDPKTGNDYSCEMTLVNPNTLEVRGFIGISLFGRTDVWKRQVTKK